VSDEELNKIFRVYPDGHKEELLSLGDPDGSAFDHALRLIDCASVLRAIIRISPMVSTPSSPTVTKGRSSTAPTMLTSIRTVPFTSWILRYRS
jgi:hypothetical protein